MGVGRRLLFPPLSFLPDRRYPSPIRARSILHPSQLVNLRIIPSFGREASSKGRPSNSLPPLLLPSDSSSFPSAPFHPSQRRFAGVCEVEGPCICVRIFCTNFCLEVVGFSSKRRSVPLRASKLFEFLPLLCSRRGRTMDLSSLLFPPFPLHLPNWSQGETWRRQVFSIVCLGGKKRKRRVEPAISNALAKEESARRVALELAEI